jgi:hypothetical protein
MAIKRFDVVVPRKYEDKNGDEKTQWNRVGSLTMFEANGDKEMGFKLELPIFGHDKFKVFAVKPKTAPNSQESAKDEIDTTLDADKASGADLPAESISF